MRRRDLISYGRKRSESTKNGGSGRCRPSRLYCLAGSGYGRALCHRLCGGALFVANLDFDLELWTALRAIRRPRDEGRHELLTAVAAWIRAWMAGRTAVEIVDVEIPMKRSSSTKTTPRAKSLERIEPTSAAPPVAEKDPESETRISLTARGCTIHGAGLRQESRPRRRRVRQSKPGPPANSSPTSRPGPEPNSSPRTQS